MRNIMFEHAVVPRAGVAACPKCQRLQPTMVRTIERRVLRPIGIALAVIAVSVGGIIAGPPGAGIGFAVALLAQVILRALLIRARNDPRSMPSDEFGAFMANATARGEQPETAWANAAGIRTRRNAWLLLPLDESDEPDPDDPFPPADYPVRFPERVSENARRMVIKRHR
ncbi:MAG: hypothetical protein AB7K09_12620 [Planctomycetota bacterium]